MTKLFKTLLGLWVTNPSLPIGNRVFELLSRFIWQLPQTLVGLLAAMGTIVFKKTKSVQYSYGCTIIKVNGKWGAFTLGSFIIGDEGLSIAPSNSLFQHEYGHYLQSQSRGPLYIFKYAIPSLLDVAKDKTNHYKHPVEQDANKRAKRYWDKTIGTAPDFNFDGWNYSSNPILTYSTLSKKISKKNLPQ